jgi:hypothetical protein
MWGLFGTRVKVLEPALQSRCTRGAPRGEPAARCSTADGQVLINPCGLKTNFFAAPLSKSL